MVFFLEDTHRFLQRCAIFKPLQLLVLSRVLSQLLETPPGFSRSIFSSHKGRKVPLCYFPIAWNVWHLATTMFHHTMLTLTVYHRFIVYCYKDTNPLVNPDILTLCLIQWYFFCMPYMIWGSGSHSATFSISQWRWWMNSSLPSVRKYLAHPQESQTKYPNINIQKRSKRNIYTVPIQYISIPMSLIIWRNCQTTMNLTQKYDIWIAVCWVQHM